MKQNITIGAYGWRHEHWLNTFYPEDLPIDDSDDWRLAFYSNEFNTVLVPADYWQSNKVLDCEDWLDSVHDGFQFFVECHVSMLDYISLSELIDKLKKLQPQLSALVFLDDQQQMSETVKSQFKTLIDSLEVDAIGATPVLHTMAQRIWRQDNPELSSFAFIENDLSDLKLARTIVEDFVSQLEINKPQIMEAIIIVRHPQLKASDLSKFRSLLEIMGH